VRSQISLCTSNMRERKQSEGKKRKKDDRERVGLWVEWYSTFWKEESIVASSQQKVQGLRHKGGQREGWGGGTKSEFRGFGTVAVLGHLILLLHISTLLIERYILITTIQNRLITPLPLTHPRQRLNNPQPQLLPLNFSIHRNILNMPNTTQPT